jgi:long-chain acyl-CoA synthetase
VSGSAPHDSERPWLRKYPPHVPPHLDYPNRLLSDVLEEAVRRWGDRTAVIFYRSRWSYRRLGEAVERFAAALAREGVGPGDRVALVLPNCPAYPIAFFATLRLGASVVQVSPFWVADDLETLLGSAKPRAAVTLERFYPNLTHGPSGRAIPVVFVARLREFYPALERPFVNLVLRRRGWRTDYPRDPRVRSWRQALRSRGSVPLHRADPVTTVAVLQFTGGTTGTPKAAMLTHRNLLANVQQLDSWDTQREPGHEVFLASIPLFHIYGLTFGFLLAIMEGGTVVLQIRSEPAELLRLIDRYRPTQLPAVPALYAGLLGRPELPRYRVGSIRYCVSGSAPLPPDVQRRFEAATGGSLVEGYGLTEASPVTHVNPVEGERRPGSIGLPLPDTEQRVVEPDGRRPLPAGEVGELEVRGPQVMLGYYEQPEETRAVLEDGWLRTGDLARLDEDGYAYIVDRKKDMINVGGMKVYPREVEEVLRGHPTVADVAVVASPDPVLGEVPRAYVVMAPGSAVDGKELIALVRGHLAHYKAPRTVEFRESLPKSAIQKTLRRALRDEAFRSAGAAAPRSDLPRSTPPPSAPGP